MHKIRKHFLAKLMVTVFSLVALILVAAGSVASSQKPTVRSAPRLAPVQPPLYSEYRGVRIGMKTQEVRAKLGSPFQKGDDLDLYTFSDNETAQIAYDASHSVTTISVDYIGGAGAPDYKLVVGADVEVKENGAIYKVVRYDSLGFWVYYNRGPGENPIVTVTLQKSVEVR